MLDGTAASLRGVTWLSLLGGVKSTERPVSTSPFKNFRFELSVDLDSVTLSLCAILPCEHLLWPQRFWVNWTQQRTLASPRNYEPLWGQPATDLPNSRDGTRYYVSEGKPTASKCGLIRLEVRQRDNVAPMSSSLRLQLALFLAIALVIAVFVMAAVASKRRNPRGLPYPPGPKGRFFVGNLFQVPRAHAWLGYHEMAKEYGKW